MDIPTLPELQNLSRREFLKLAGAGLLALVGAHFGAGAGLARADWQDEPPIMARVLSRYVTVFDKPTLKGEKVKQYGVDQVLPVTGITLGEDYPAYNRVWYQVNDEGYVHSGVLQPVEVRLNPVEKSVPAKGQLAEVTVPYTDTRYAIKRSSKNAFRMYYASVYWVVGVEQAPDGKYWYKIYDERHRIHLYVDCAHVRLLPPEELQTISPQVPTYEKRLEVRLEEQLVIAYERDRAVFITRAATGAKFSDGDFRTPKGEFQTSRKRPTRHMAAGEPGIGTGFDLPGVPWVSYLTPEGVAFHGTYWHNDFGRPRSHGCINLSPSAARWVYRWTLPAVPIGEDLLEEDEGTRVLIA